MKYMLVLLIGYWLSTSPASAQPSGPPFGPGFDAQECDDLLQLNFAFLDTTPGNRFEGFLPGHQFVYRSASIGLDNVWDLWIREDSTVIVVLRGTTADPKSILADFLCAMSPAKGHIVLAPGDTLDYQLAAHPRAAVHTGFLIGFGYLAKDMLPKVDSLHAAGYRNYLVAGHSQGGSLSYYVSAWLYYLEKSGMYPGLQVKTYASAPPKMGNMYFAYDYDNATRAEWAFSMVNTSDAIPEMPFTTQQIDVDIAEPNPILRLMKRFDDLPFFQRLVLKRAFNKMRRGAAKSSKAYQKYLGGYTAKFIEGMVPGLVIPDTVNTTYFVRPGVPITLMTDDAYVDYFKELAKEGPYYHHNPTTYRYLLRRYYDGLTDLTADSLIKHEHGRLTVAPNGHYLQYEDGAPFFWLGDTAWELFHRLTREEIRQYLDNRKEKGFNVIQAVVLAEMDGLYQPNQYGDIPLIDQDPEKPNKSYFELVDDVLQMADERQLFMGLLPTWGDKVTRMWGRGPEVFTAENAYRYGHWLGNRYKEKENIIWILGGDRPAIHDSVDTRPIWREMARGILDATAGEALISYHISGGDRSTSQQLHSEPWLHVNMMQSGHGSGHDVPVWEWITRDRTMVPTKPTLDSEPNYEDHPVNPWPQWNPEDGYFDDYDVRKQTYRSVFAGACGVTYGHHSIWQFWSEREEKINHAACYWTEALDRPGAYQVGYLRQLIESRPFADRIPDQTIIVNGQGEKGQHIRAFRDGAGSYLMAYIPQGRTITVDVSSLGPGELRGWWFNPATATAIDLGTVEHTNNLELTTPTQGFGNDWVLVIDRVAAGYSMPVFGRHAHTASPNTNKSLNFVS